LLNLLTALTLVNQIRGPAGAAARAALWSAIGTIAAANSKLETE
jgi:hypothetical protein